MEVILREDVQHLGHIGDIVKVRPGYARNYLLPRGLATVADKRNLRVLEHEKRVVEDKRKRAMSASPPCVPSVNIMSCAPPPGALRQASAIAFKLLCGEESLGARVPRTLNGMLWTRIT